MIQHGCGGIRPRVHPTPITGAKRMHLPGLALAALLVAPFLSAGDNTPTMLLLDGARAATDIIAVGERGTILKLSGNSGRWTSVESPVKAPLTAISMAPDGNRGWAVGHDAIILVTQDAGRTWTLQWQGESLEDSFLDVIALDASRVIAVGAYGLYLQSGDAGQSWSRIRIAEEDLHLNRISRGPTGTLYLAGERGTLLRSRDDGANWTPIPASYDGSFFGILPLEDKTLLAYGLRGHVYRSTDDGASWTLVDIAHPVLIATGIRLGNGNILIAGHARALLLSRDGGNTFSSVPTAMMTAIAELLGLPDGRVLALGEAGATFLSPP